MRRELTILVLAAKAVFGQSAGEFEVVSIKPHPEPITMSSNGIRGSTYRGVAITLQDLIQDAYNVQRNQVSGGPHWLTSAPFDVEAKAAGDTELAMDRARPMLQAMLADRFKLKLRHENREVPAYDLVIIKGGPKFKENTDPAVKLGGMTTRVDPSGVHMKATKSTMARLTVQLSLNAGRPVVDKTGLGAGYDFTLDWAADNSPAAMDGSVATLFTALQEQLALKLEPSRTTQEFLVIESAETPSWN
jgi:uncharacterized protein (TIGR03435 family)